MVIFLDTQLWIAPHSPVFKLPVIRSSIHQVGVDPKIHAEILASQQDLVTKI